LDQIFIGQERQGSQLLHPCFHAERPVASTFPSNVKELFCRPKNALNLVINQEAIPEKKYHKEKNLDSFKT